MRVSQVLRSSARFYATEAMVSVLLGLALVVLLVVAPQEAREWNHVRRLNILDAVGFQATSPEAQVLVTGILDGDLSDITGELVVYIQQQWTTVYEAESGSYQSLWGMSKQVVPALTILVQGQQLQTAAVASVEQGGSQHTVVPGNNRSAGEEGVSDRPTRLVGFRNGDRVTVVGYKNTDGNLVPTRLYGGTRDALLKELGIRMWGDYLGGGALILAALLILWPRLAARQKEHQCVSGHQRQH